MDEEWKEKANNLWGEDVKIVNPTFYHANDTLSVLILYREGFDSKTLKEDFQNFINEYLGQSINYDIMVEQSLNDAEVEKSVTKLLSKYKTGTTNLFSKVKILENEKGKSLILTCIREIDAKNINDIIQEVQNFLSEKSIEEYRVSVDFDSQYTNLNGDELLEKREQEMLASIEDVVIDEHPTYQVEISHIIYGNKITNIARKISTLRNEDNGVLVAGKVHNFRENYYTKKDNPEEQKVRYNFSLDDGTGEISAVFFPPKKLLEKGEFSLEEDAEIIVYCDVSLYKDTLSIKVRELAECVLPELNLSKEEDEDKEVDGEEDICYITEVPEKYNLVSPKPYVELTQLDMFSMTSVPPRNLIGKEFVVFDLETTGFDPTMCDIIEIGAVKLKDGKIVESFTTLLKPRKSIPQEITELTGISDDMVVFAPSFSEVVADFYKFTRGATMVAHNANFDIPFLRYHASNLRYNFDNEVKDTLAMARAMVKGVKNYKLKTLTEHFNIILVDAHRALNDTVATAKVFIELCKLEKDEK